MRYQITSFNRLKMTYFYDKRHRYPMWLPQLMNGMRNPPIWMIRVSHRWHDDHKVFCRCFISLMYVPLYPLSKLWQFFLSITNIICDGPYRKKVWFKTLTLKFRYVPYLNFDFNVWKHVFFPMDHNTCFRLINANLTLKIFVLFHRKKILSKTLTSKVRQNQVQTGYFLPLDSRLLYCDVP